MGETGSRSLYLNRTAVRQEERGDRDRAQRQDIPEGGLWPSAVHAVHREEEAHGQNLPWRARDKGPDILLVHIPCVPPMGRGLPGLLPGKREADRPGLLPPVRRAVDPVHGRGREVQRMDPEPRPVCRSEAIRGKWGPDRPFAAPPPGRYNAEPERSGHGQPYQR